MLTRATCNKVGISGHFWALLTALRTECEQRRRRRCLCHFRAKILTARRFLDPFVMTFARRIFGRLIGQLHHPLASRGGVEDKVPAHPARLHHHEPRRRRAAQVVAAVRPLVAHHHPIQRDQPEQSAPVVYVSMDHDDGVHPRTLQLHAAHRPRPDVVRVEPHTRAPHPPISRARAVGAVDARGQGRKALSPSLRLPTRYRAAASAIRV